jgi:hypothetical protein
MKTTSIENVINKSIEKQINSGESLIDIYYTLKEKINRFENKEDFIDVSEEYLKKNWNNINFKKRYTSYYTIYLRKRKSDIMWLISNSDYKFKGLNDVKLFSLLKLKDKLSVNHVTS